MRNITRLSKPVSISRNSTKWTQKLLNEITRCSANGDKVKEKFYSKYNRQDIKDALNKMYSNCCCYCESKLGIVDFPHIEHRRPKRGTAPNCFPELCYDWDNLHLCCTRCNVSKGNKYDPINPILDAVIDNDIETHFTYHLGVEGDLLWCPKTLRAKTTEKDTDLNRIELGKARLEIFIEVFNVLKEIKENPTNVSNGIALRELRKKSKGHGSYGSVIKFLLSNQGFQVD